MDSGNNGALYGYNVNRCVGTDCTPIYEAFVSTGTSYTDTNVTSGTTYRYSIVASWETGGLSASSNWEYATAQATTGQPTGLTVTSSSETDISLSWTAPADDGNGALDGYNVYRCEGTDCTPAYHDWVPVADGTSYTDTGGDTGPVISRHDLPLCGSCLAVEYSWFPVELGICNGGITTATRLTRGCQSYRVESDSSQCGFNQPELETLGQGCDDSL